MRILFKGRNKYGAKRTLYDGNVYHSKREADYARGLDLRMKAGEIGGWIRQVPYDLEVNGQKICRYIADFVVVDKEGKKEIHEVKGMVTGVWKIKEKLFRALYPDIELKVIK